MVCFQWELKNKSSDSLAAVQASGRNGKTFVTVITRRLATGGKHRCYYKACESPSKMCLIFLHG